MAKKREKLTGKQAYGICTIISLLCFVCGFIIFEWPTEELVGFWIIEVFGTPLIVFVVLFFILNPEKRGYEEKYEKMKDRIQNSLSYDKTTQVYLKDKEYSGWAAIFNKISKEEEYKFFAKLIGNEEINLSIRNKYGNEICYITISDLKFFNSNFKFEE